MTQTNEAAVKSEPTKALFNIIVAPNLKAIQAIAAQYDLKDVRPITQLAHSLRLPETGRERGDKINEALSAVDHTVTIAIEHDDPWIKALLGKNAALAPMVWRAIESKLLGHRTNQQRNLLIVASSEVTKGVREAANAGNLLSFTAGQKVPSEWLQPRPEPVKKEKPAKAKSPALKEYVDKNLKPRAEAIKKGDTKEAARLKAQANPGSPAVPKGKPERRPLVKGSANGLKDDLYLLCKGHYGDTNKQAVVLKGAVLVRHHGGLPATATISMQSLIVQLFETLIRSSSRGYWGGFTLLKDVVEAGAEDRVRLMEVLIGHIAAIPAVDGEGKPLAQPKVNPHLVKVLEQYDMSEVASV